MGIADCTSSGVPVKKVLSKVYELKDRGMYMCLDMDDNMKVVHVEDGFVRVLDTTAYIDRAESWSPWNGVRGVDRWRVVKRLSVLSGVTVDGDYEALSTAFLGMCDDDAAPWHKMVRDDGVWYFVNIAGRHLVPLHELVRPMIVRKASA